MIKARGKLGNGQNVVIIGLTWEDMRKMRAGANSKIDLEEIGLDGHILIFAGASDETMAEELKGIAAADGVLPRPVAESDKDSIFPINPEDTK